MSITSLTRSLFTLLAATLLLASSARGVEHNRDIIPLIDPLSFNPDFQFFAPADLGDFGEPPDANTGWFAEYKRTYIWVSRPQREITHDQGDFTWGNTFDVGWMKEDEGWWLSGMHITGPNEADNLIQPRINRVDLDDIDPDDGPVFPPQDGNDPEGFGRFFNVQQSVNIGRLSNIELNKVWRMEPLHKGGSLEPFMGFRYMHFLDKTVRSTYFRTDDTGLPIPGGVPDDDTAFLEHFIQDTSHWRNDMFGGQLGVRVTEYKSRWLLSNELRVFALQNFQGFTERIDNLQVLFDSATTDGDVTAELLTRERFAAHEAEFVWGIDVKVDASFQLTRDICILVGGQVMHMPKGIARGNLETFNSEDLTMAGVFFGGSLNR